MKKLNQTEKNQCFKNKNFPVCKKQTGFFNYIYFLSLPAGHTFMQIPQTTPLPIILNSFFIKVLHFSGSKISLLSMPGYQSLPFMAPEGQASAQRLQPIQTLSEIGSSLSRGQSVKREPRRTLGPYSLCRKREFLPTVPSPARQANFL